MLFVFWVNGEFLVKSGSTCLILAIEFRHEEAAELLIEPTKEAGALDLVHSVSEFRVHRESVSISCSFLDSSTDGSRGC